MLATGIGVRPRSLLRLPASVHSHCLLLLSVSSVSLGFPSLWTMVFSVMNPKSTCAARPELRLEGPASSVFPKASSPPAILARLSPAPVPQPEVPASPVVGRLCSPSSQSPSPQPPRGFLLGWHLGPSQGLPCLSVPLSLFLPTALGLMVPHMAHSCVGRLRFGAVCPGARAKTQVVFRGQAQP